MDIPWVSENGQFVFLFIKEFLILNIGIIMTILVNYWCS